MTREINKSDMRNKSCGKFSVDLGCIDWGGQDWIIFFTPLFVVAFILFSFSCYPFFVAGKILWQVTLFFRPMFIQSECFFRLQPTVYANCDHIYLNERGSMHQINMIFSLEFLYLTLLMSVFSLFVIVQWCWTDKAICGGRIYYVLWIPWWQYIFNWATKAE